MDSRNTHLKGTRWKNLSRNVHGEVVLRQYSEHKAEQQEQEQYKEPHEEPMLTSLWPYLIPACGRASAAGLRPHLIPASGRVSAAGRRLYIARPPAV